MKSLVLFLTIFISITAFASHNHKNKNMNMNMNMNMKVKSITVSSPKFLSPYFVIHAKLIKDVLPSKKEIKALELSLNKEIKSNKNKSARKQLIKAEKFIKAMQNNDMSKFRANFYELSKILIVFSKKYNLRGVQAYYCPMVKKTWLQNQSDITYNPYMPKKMLHCGSKI